MQNELHVEILGGKQGEYGIFEKLKSHGDWFREEEE